ncbi:PHP domain-containing protein [bacterium]|nr:PHP domain-containing protein [bacterium]
MLALKTDFHIHTKEDRKDHIEHTSYELIRHAAYRGFKALSITNHDTFTFSSELERYAADHGILLIPGIEKTVEKRHVLILNAYPATEKIETFEDLRKAKDDDLFFIAPHPFFKTGGCLEQKLYEHLDLFDAIEHSFFYSSWFNLNREAWLVSEESGLPMVGNSDCHILKHFGLSHSIVRSEIQTMEAVFSAIRARQVEVVSQPIFFPKLAAIIYEMTLNRRRQAALQRQAPRLRVEAPSQPAELVSAHSAIWKS